MDDETQISKKPDWPVIVHLGPSSIEDLLQNIDPAPDEETERFVAAIYADRHEAAGATSAQ